MTAEVALKSDDGWGASAKTSWVSHSLLERFTAMTTTASTAHSDTGTVRRATPLLGAGTFLLSSVWTVLGAHDTREIVVVLAAAAIITAAVYGFLMPRALTRPSAGGTALTLSAVAVVLTLPAFWSGLPLILGVAGAALGYAGRNAGSGTGRSVTAIVLGALAVLGYLAIYLVDGVVMGNL